MNKIVRKEKSLCCKDGVVTFTEFIIDEKPVVLGLCDNCGGCCGEYQTKTVEVRCDGEIIK